MLRVENGTHSFVFLGKYRMKLSVWIELANRTSPLHLIRKH